MKKLQVTLASTFMVMALVACNQDNNGNNDNAPEQEADLGTEQGQGADSTEDLNNANIQVDMEKAVSEFENAYPDASISSIELEAERGTWQYEIQGLDDEKEYEIIVDANTQEVTNEREEALDANDAGGVERKEDALDMDNIIDPQEAVDIALSEAEGAISSWKLEKDDQVTYYEVTVTNAGNDYDIKLDATNGEVLGTDRDD